MSNIIYNVTVLPRKRWHAGISENDYFDENALMVPIPPYRYTPGYTIKCSTSFYNGMQVFCGIIQ